MKTILIPTDFSLSSLDCIPDLYVQQEQELNLIFVHLFKLSDAIGDLLMLSRRSKEYEYISDDFYTQCEELKSKFPGIRSIKIDFFYGSTLSTFRNFLEAHSVDYILDPSNCCCKKLNKSSIDPTALFNKSGLPGIIVRKAVASIVPLPVIVEELQLAEA